MNQSFSRIAPALSTSILAALMVCAPVAAIAAPVAAAPVAPANPAIIKLPLQPMVPADKRVCALKTASGLGYTALREGTGPKPGKTDFVLIGYIGYLATTGQVFDQNQQTPLSLANVIPGFTEGLQLMARGSVWRLCVPAALGYGAAGAGDAIPANSDLVFQIELVDSKSAAEVEAMRGAQQGSAATPAPAAPASH
ncbi:FKBP-type peptidyl-prolyl cis-trans isomerase [Novosphingobium sp.]|uniref:FKBP-type peptidyl-prolyl cis-trans isomerase n=1 Tax=Novosphingobium sp. TaxID=1874826 RepID=UPI003B51C73F